jgi:hypothetical protein
MMMLCINIDDHTYRNLLRSAEELGRSTEDLAECAVSEAVLAEAKRRGWPTGYTKPFLLPDVQLTAQDTDRA